MSCNPNCKYFPNEDIVYDYEIDENGVKYRKNKERVCLFNLSKIKSWDRECPKEKISENLLTNTEECDRI